MKKLLALLAVLVCLASNSCAEGTEGMEIYLTIGRQEFTCRLEDSDTARALSSLLPMTLYMSELNGNEKYHYLLSGLPMDEQDIRDIHTGDLMLFGDNCVVLFYHSFQTSYRYTRIGAVTDAEGLQNALGEQDVEVRFSLDPPDTDLGSAEDDLQESLEDELY